MRIPAHQPSTVSKNCSGHAPLTSPAISPPPPTVNLAVVQETFGQIANIKVVSTVVVEDRTYLPSFYLAHIQGASIERRLHVNPEGQSRSVPHGIVGRGRRLSGVGRAAPPGFSSPWNDRLSGMQSCVHSYRADAYE